MTTSERCKKSSICFILFEFESYLKTDMNRIVIPKSLSLSLFSPSLLPAPSQIVFALMMMNDIARSSSSGIQLPALLCLIKLNYKFNRQKTSLSYLTFSTLNSTFGIPFHKLSKFSSRLPFLYPRLFTNISLPLLNYFQAMVTFVRGTCLENMISCEIWNPDIVTTS